MLNFSTKHNKTKNSERNLTSQDRMKKKVPGVIKNLHSKTMEIIQHINMPVSI